MPEQPMIMNMHMPYAAHSVQFYAAAPVSVFLRLLGESWKTKIGSSLYKTMIGGGFSMLKTKQQH